ncbi:VOC family protein [Ureibacillus acetophenoni]|uniref:Catechol 2,3-dioxygenase-like lactoylglutathione lyase family enzyme n=1 Tax=Ureibacillus acetophenoni TaxID=614649 RepID=A0A285ULV6_9BACL|nr:VOC family protein [Ureibacillus acetophenoni]SOC42677.1 catechol 2,3-dioxygenase-like lactoylglutathione lyase family enzyme [Ureibacillus acetophenoni]
MNPIVNQVGTIFIPVSNIEKARKWYCDILGLPADGEILFDHLYILPMKGTGIVLDSKIYSEDNRIKIPLFHLNTSDIEEAYEFMKSKNVELTTEIQHNHWFNFKDPDGNHLMVCNC